MVMMRKIGFAIAVVAVVGGAPAFAEEVKVADGRQAKIDDGYFVVFVSKRVAAEDPVGDALIAVGKGEAPDSIEIVAAHGMSIEGGEPKVGPVSGEDVDALRASAEGEPTLTFIVKVDQAQYDEILGAMRGWESSDVIAWQSPSAELLDATSVVFGAIGELKRPYRSGGRRSPNMQTYFADMMVLNRKR